MTGGLAGGGDDQARAGGGGWRERERAMPGRREREEIRDKP
jgi:hypothetical protein